MPQRKCSECGDVFDAAAGSCRSGHPLAVSDPIGGLPTTATASTGVSRVKHRGGGGGVGSAPGGPVPPTPAMPAPSVPTPVAAIRTRGVLVHIDGRVISDVDPADSAGRSHPIEVLMPLSALVALLLCLPLLVAALLPLVAVLVVLLIVPTLFMKQGSGCLFNLLGLLLPRRARPDRPVPSLHFRVEAAGPRAERRDLVLVGHRSGLRLGDEVRVTALRGAAPLQVLSLQNVTSSGRLQRRGLTGLVISSTFLALVSISGLVGLLVSGTS